MTDLKPCPSCREPMDHPSGDGCANMTAHKEKAMTDEELIARLRDDSGDWLTDAAADRIEALTEQLTAARQDAKEAEAYAEELEDKLSICERHRDAYAEMDRIGTQAVRDLEAKLTKAVEALGRIQDGSYGRAAAISRTTLAEIKGESHE